MNDVRLGEWVVGLHVEEYSRPIKSFDGAWTNRHYDRLGKEGVRGGRDNISIFALIRRCIYKTRYER